MIEIQNLNKKYAKGDVRALKNLSLKIHAGEYISIMGTSGSGKSTLLHILGLLDSWDDGRYLLNGCDISGLNDNKLAEIRNSYIGFVFQSFHLIQYKTALENVEIPLLYGNIPLKKRKTIAMDMLERLGVADRAHHLPSEMSGGQNQRVAIARALVNHPKLLLADEPTGALDSATSADIVSLLREINGWGITIIVVTHDKKVAESADRVLYMQDGVLNSNALDV